MTAARLLDGKRAVVTGGGGGIGRAISLLFAEHGAEVIAAEIDPDLAAAMPLRTVVCDVTRSDDVRRLAEEAGEVDILVNNVGHYLYRGKDFVESTEQEWDALYRVNLLHVFLCTQVFAPGMIVRRGGSIINVSTVEAFRGKPHSAVYAAFKGGVTQFTKSVALELGAHGIRVNAIAPDLTQTLQVPYDRWISDEQRYLIPTWVPIGRLGMPEDIAGVALFLASDLSSFVTGTTVHADGGSYAAGGWFKTARGGWTNRPVNP
jgi:NAD(P)-dependent dehydrogenase (short-subunit alcohol dehydrogenase family)